ncbi:tensin-1 isoform X4 [Frankliniella occidentalis]|uniref:Tensin-1 isoform X4 n=1 Tax=Frankliniella occidentalis TaxID=133901 RepID=A0A9C6U461_FRAOC|nr:tensin-1 isoform X4 [Frankliniella occidentalis]
MPWLKSCLSPQPARKKPTISPPLHLLLKPDGESQNHVFRAKVFKKPRPCHLCHQPIHQLGSCCRVCKYVCHKACESKYIKETQQKPGAKGKTTTPGQNTSVNNNNISTLPNNNSSGGGGTLGGNGGGGSSSGGGSTLHKSLPSAGTGGSTAVRRAARARPRDAMDLRYVTERIIALWVPGDVGRAAYLQGQQQAANMLRTKHADNYMVFNLSAPRRSLRQHHQSVRELGWPRDLAPPLERLCSICKDMDSWLKGGPRRIAVVHARGSKDRIGVVVAAYMHYSQICGGADQALDRFAMKRFLQDQVEDVDQPSHRRYVDYFSGLLSGSIKINSAPLYLTHVTVLGAPSFEPTHPDGPDPGGGAPGAAGGVAGGCRAFLRVYEGLVPVHTSAVYCVAEDARAFTVNVAAERGRRGLQLRGDVLVKCYHRHYTKKIDPNDPTHYKEAREIVFAAQFHTCAVSDYTLSFTRSELDYACDDLRFPLDGAVELHFSPTPEPRLPSPAPTPAVPTLDSSEDPVTRWDSYEHLSNLGASDDEDGDIMSEHDDELSHTYGPLDGSLYATVGRKQQLQMQQEALRQRQLQHQQQQHIQLHHQRMRALQPAGASPGSEHTISMDSGISSAGNGGSSSAGGGGAGQHAATPGAAASPASSSQRALDDLLNDMLLTVESIPDLKPERGGAAGGGVDLQRQQRGGDSRHYQQRAPPAPTAPTGVCPPPRPARQSSLSPGPVSPLLGAAPGRAPASATAPTTEPELDEIPYHARLDGRPFTYVPGAPQQQQPQQYHQQQPAAAMAPSVTSNGLSSPGLVRKAHANGANGYATSTPSRVSNGTPVGSPGWSSTPREPSSSARFQDDVLSDGPGGRSHLTWLQRQQQKLRERREGLLRSARQPHEARLLSELRSLHSTGQAGAGGRQASRQASRRLDGYTSDTTMFADEDEEDFCRPLHVNTGAAKLNGGLSAPGSPLQRRTAPYNTAHQPYALSRQKSDSSFDRERPFVSVKRGYEQRSKYESPADTTVHSVTFDRTPSSHYTNSNNSQNNSQHLSNGYANGYANGYSNGYSNGLSNGASHYSNGSGHYSTPRPEGPAAPHRTPPSAGTSAAARTLFHNHVNGVGNGKLSGPPSPEDILILDGHHQDALACLMASLASPSESPTSASSPLSMSTPSPPAACSPVTLARDARNASDSSTNSTYAWQSVQQQREDSYSSWRSEEDRFSRPQTPAFPVQPRTPYSNNGHQFDSAGLPPKSPTTQRRSGSFKHLRRWPSNSSVSSKDRSPSPMSDMQGQGIYMQHSPKSPVGANGGQSSPTVYSMHSRRSSTHSNSEPPQEVAAHHVKFVRDTSRYWYKPNISREDAISLLRESPPGTFVVRDSNSFPGAFGLALKVAVPPATVAQKAAFFSGDASELVRHFLIEPTSRGVKLKGCTNEPVFSSLSALVYQHSIMAMALPCKLLLPDGELGVPGPGATLGGLQARHVSELGSSPSSTTSGSVNSAQQLLAQGAACNVLYLFTTDTESLTGPQAIRRAVQQLFTSRPLPSATVVHFKVSSQGITLTDSKRRLFFRRHYPVSTISHCGLDPDDHRWSQKSPDTGMPISSNRCFGFVARKPASRSDNQCHIFAELEPEQPATAIVNFVSKVMMSGVGQKNVV